MKHKTFKVGDEFSFKLCAQNADLSKVDALMPLFVDATRLMAELVDCEMQFDYSYHGYHRISLDEHRFRRHVSTLDETWARIENFAEWARGFQGEISVAPYGPEEGNYWYYLDEDNIVTRVILVDPG